MVTMITSIMIILGIIFVIIGFLGPIQDFLKKRSGNYKEIIGKVVDYKSEQTTYADGDNVTMYYPITEYIVDGKNYNYISKVGISIKGKAGKQKKLLYNEDNPEEIINPINKFASLIYSLVGGIVILLAIIVSKNF